MMINNPDKELIEGLNKHINDKCGFKVYLFEKPNTDLFPKVIFQRIASPSGNNIRNRIEAVQNVVYEINVFTKDLVIENNLYDSKEVAETISFFIREYMQYCVGLNTFLDQPTPNIDDTIYRITLQFKGQLHVYRGYFG